MIAMPTSGPRLPATPVAARLEARATRGFAWVLFGGLWAKLLVAVLLSQPTLDAEVDSVYNRLADLLLLGGLFAALVAYADDILRHSPRLVVVVILGLASFLITEALTGLNLRTAVFEYLKIVTPALLSLALMRLYARDPALVLQLCRVTLALVWGLACLALVFLPPSLNRGGEKFWPVYFASLHTASYLMVVCAALSLYLFEAGQLGRRLLIGLVACSCVLIFYGWGVRTSMVAALAFGLVYVGQRSRMLPLAVLLAVAFGLALGLVPLLLGIVHLPTWEEMVEMSSGRVSMWLQKAAILADSGLAEWLFGHGEGSDWIVSEVWWWSAKDSHNDFIRLLNQQGLVGLGLVLAMLVTWAGVFPRGVAAPLLTALAASTAFSNGIMFRPQASLVMPLALVAATAAWQRRSLREASR